MNDIETVNHELLEALKVLLEHHGLTGCDSHENHHEDNCIKFVRKAQQAIANAEQIELVLRKEQNEA